MSHEPEAWDDGKDELIADLRHQLREMRDETLRSWAALKAEQEARARAESDLKAYLEDTAVTCAFCQARHERPVTFDDIKAHIFVCPTHPLAEARAALAAEREKTARIRAETLEEAANSVEAYCVLKQKPWPGMGMPYHDSCPQCRAARIIRALSTPQTQEPDRRHVDGCNWPGGANCTCAAQTREPEET